MKADEDSLFTSRPRISDISAHKCLMSEDFSLQNVFVTQEKAITTHNILKAYKKCDRFTSDINLSNSLIHIYEYLR